MPHLHRDWAALSHLHRDWSDDLPRKWLRYERRRLTPIHTNFAPCVPSAANPQNSSRQRRQHIARNSQPVNYGRQMAHNNTLEHEHKCPQTMLTAAICTLYVVGCTGSGHGHVALRPCVACCMRRAAVAVEWLSPSNVALCEENVALLHVARTVRSHYAAELCLQSHRVH